ncbi:MAG: FAD-dependent oxidoreductase [Methylocystaceae bacterium]
MSANLMHPVIVIGGGVTGMAAAMHLAQAGKMVLLLEKEAALGGKALHINCKQVQGKCTHCGACAVFELEHKVNRHPLVQIINRSRVEAINSQIKTVEVTVATPEGRWVVVGNSALIATGLKPFPAKERHETGYGNIPRVITALELEKRARQSGNFTFLGSSPRLAIIHCVGSRQRYCSRVCCLYGAKISRLLTEAIPDASIDAYCLDRQRYRAEYVAEWPSDVQMRRAMPGRVYQDPEGDCVIRAEDMISGLVSEHHYDWVVLCTGLVPDPDAVALGIGAGLVLDEYGFLMARSNLPRIWAAGGATAPLSFFECIESGIWAAGELVKLLD